MSNFDSICCEKCDRWYHINCTNLTNTAFNDYCDNKDKNWKCDICMLKLCRKCDLTLKYRTGNSLCCLICKYNIHLKCYSNTSFHEIDNNKLKKLYDIKYNKQSLETTNIKYYNSYNICMTKVLQPQKYHPQKMQ